MDTLTTAKWQWRIQAIIHDINSIYKGIFVGMAGSFDHSARR